jgi:hypothetical protein
MADSYREDKSKYRALVSGTHDNYTGTYNVDDKIGRNDWQDRAVVTTVSATSSVALLPATPLGRRTYIKVKNEGGVDVEILTAADQSSGDGYIVDANGGEWEETTDATLYIVSTGADSNVRVYERATKPWNDGI